MKRLPALLAAAILAGLLNGCCAIPATIVSPVTGTFGLLQEIHSEPTRGMPERVATTILAVVFGPLISPPCAFICGIDADIGFVRNGHYRGETGPGRITKHPSYVEAFNPVVNLVRFYRPQIAP